jgi:rod shape-determining protein MreC
MLVVLGKADVLLFDRLRVAVADAVSPLLEIIAQPVSSAASMVERVEGMADVYRQNDVLREENRRLLQWQEAARRLAAENDDLRALAKLVPESPVASISGRVIADSGGAFLRNVLVDAGARDGVERGQAAMSGDGLVGRVAEVGERTARILLLTDLNSHIPVMLESTNERAVLDGDNSDQPQLAYLQAKEPVKIGDRIVTAGSGGIFPPGLPVGVISTVEGGVVRVAPYAELSRLELLRLVDYGLGGLLPESAVPPARPVKTGRSRTADAAR